MTAANALILGLIQGIAEFLPISSSGHLVIAQHFITGFEQPGMLFDVVLHVGTLAATLIYFRKDIFNILNDIIRKEGENRGMAILIIVGSIPTAIIGLLLKDYVEGAFTSLQIVASMLLFTGAILFLAGMIKKRGKDSISLFDAFIIGMSQGIAVIPGISRSGITISTGIFRNIDAETAGSFSFLLSIPAIVGAIVLEGRHFSSLERSSWGIYLLGAFSAMFCGIISIHFLMSILRSEKISYFAIYCFIIGGITFFIV